MSAFLIASISPDKTMSSYQIISAWNEVGLFMTKKSLELAKQVT
jgi:hypothetical protein